MITFFIDPVLKINNCNIKLQARRYTAGFKNLEYLSKKMPVNAYIERGGMFLFNGEKVSNTEELSKELIKSGAHQIYIPKDSFSDEIAFAASNLFKQQKIDKNLPKAYQENLFITNIIESRSHLLSESLYEKILKNLTYKGNEIAIKLSALTVGSAGALFLLYTFPLNNFLLRGLSASYLLSSGIMWQYSKKNYSQYLDALQAAFRPTFSQHNSETIKFTKEAVSLLTNEEVKNEYLKNLPKESKALLNL